MEPQLIYTNPETIAAALGKFLIDSGYFGGAGVTVWTKQECADALKITTLTLDDLINRGLPCKDLAEKGSQRRCLRFIPADVLAWMRENYKK